MSSFNKFAIVQIKNTKFGKPVSETWQHTGTFQTLFCCATIQTEAVGSFKHKMENK